MRSSYLNRLAIVTVGLAIAAANTVPANASINDTAVPAANEIVAPSSELTFGTIELVGERVAPEKVAFTRTAQSRANKRRFRTTQPRRTFTKGRVRKPGSVSSGANPGTNAPAPLDCSIESHPDCLYDDSSTGRVFQDRSHI